MVRFDISILGDKELEQALKLLPANLERNVLNKAIKEGAKTVLADAKRKAPTRKVIIAPGTTKARARKLRRIAAQFDRLRNSLHVRAMKRKRGRIGYVVAAGTRQELQIDPKAKGYYPAHLHLGWKVENGSRTVPARPFLRSALLEDQGRVLAQVRDALRRRLESGKL